MWVIKEQTKRNPSGKQVSPVMETQSGADEMLALFRKQAFESADKDDNPRQYFIAQYIKRGTK